jgi:hypothetical protein
MYVQPVVLADATGVTASFSSSGQLIVAPVAPVSPVTVLGYANGAQSAANVGDSFSTVGYTSAAIYITLTSFTGGTSPSITFVLQGLGVSNVWYTLWSNTTPLSTAAAIVANIGPGQSGGTASTGNGGFSAVFPLTCRFGWSTTGTPTAWNGSASVTVR